MTDRREQDTFQILVATDIHLGYAETDPIRGNDSFITFEEILQTAQKRDVDFILLGGDLFHDNKPSMNTLQRCISLLRQYCMGDKPVSIQLLSSREEIFKHCYDKNVNYEDPNLNISIPVFSIHGNHDDPAGHNCRGSMDVLSSTGHINYFSKWTDLSQVALMPLLMKKGSTKLAIYGLSHIKDDRLARLFKEKKVEFKIPSENPNTWCNIMILHQNRVDRGLNKYITEDMLPNFLQLVIWGHEHECRIQPEYNPNTGFRVIQPGSPVATSLSEGESIEKHVAIVRVHNTDAIVEPIELQTVRPFIFDTVCLDKVTKLEGEYTVVDQAVSYVSELAEDMLSRARAKLTGHPKQPKLPLLRIRVEYNHERQYFNPIRFGDNYTDRVANPSDMIKMSKDKKGSRTKKEENLDEEAMKSAVDGALDDVDESIDDEDMCSKVERVIEVYFSNEDNNKNMSVLSVVGVNEAVTRFIEKDEKQALIAVIEHQKKKTKEYLMNRTDCTEENILDCVEEFRQLRATISRQEISDEISIAVDESMSGERNGRADIILNSDDDEINGGGATAKSPARSTRGRGRGATTRGRRGASKASETSDKSTAGKRTLNKDSDSDDNSFSKISNTSSRSRGRGSRGGSTRSRRAAGNSTSSRAKTRTSQASIQDIFSSQLLSAPSPTKRRKMQFESSSDSE